MWYLINFLQLIIIGIWTAFCAVVGALLVVILGSKSRSLYINSHYIWTPVVLAVSFIKVKYTGRENVRPTEPHIYVSNHESQMDIPALFHSIPVPLFFLIKKELKKVPFMGWYAAFIGMIFIDRGDREKAYKGLLDAGERIKQGKNVMSFPEGTRNKDGNMKMFKRGSFKLASTSDIGVVPISIKGSREILPSGSMKMRPGTIIVRIGTPVYHRDFPNMDVDEFAGHVRGMVIEMRNS